MFFTYVLKSLSTGRHYYGSTSDIEKRLKYHNSGKVRSTKAFRPSLERGRCVLGHS